MEHGIFVAGSANAESSIAVHNHCDVVTLANDDSSLCKPPPPPEPHAASTIDVVAAARESLAITKHFSDEPVLLQHEHWDISSISPLAALRMLTDALQSLAETMGDVPPTPPVSRPTTPRSQTNLAATRPQRQPSPEGLDSMTIGSPEAQPHEPITVEVGADAEDITLQRVAIARRFFSKVAPPFSLLEYMTRLHRWCPHSSGVYLAAANYCYRLCVADLMVPATSRTVHRLALAAVRVAAKALEDNKWSQDMMAKVGGVSRTQLMNLEVTLCFLLDFDLGVDERSLAKRMFQLQQAAQEGQGTRGMLSSRFRLRLPSRIVREKAALG